MIVLILGANGMLGNAVMRSFSRNEAWDVHGTLRSMSSLRFFSSQLTSKLHCGVDVEDFDVLVSLLGKIRPDVIINCIGQIKQVEGANEPLRAIPINAVFPHRLAHLCKMIGARLVHISTDCVYSGTVGNYKEEDIPDANDLYGRTKLLGEVDYSNAITIRTSIIGHELDSSRGLIGWFLSQKSSVKGYTDVVFSGLPTCELARIIQDFVIPNSRLQGIYHVSADPISKYDLLKLVRDEYQLNIEIEPDSQIKLDRSLNSQRFSAATGYIAPAWRKLISEMKSFK
jgi:dTDP-4-dehydrorhamnose reductase